MKIKVELDLDQELAPALQQHLNGGISVKDYVAAALQFFNLMLEKEQAGSSIGFGDKAKFKHYNMEVSPKNYIDAFKFKE